MEEKLKDLLFKMECSEAQLSADINFLHCVQSEFLMLEKPEESLQYIYWQLQSMIETLTKSMEYNQKEMRKAIDESFKFIRKEER